jgi:hypothetical protein
MEKATEEYDDEDFVNAFNRNVFKLLLVVMNDLDILYSSDASVRNNDDVSFIL